MDYRLCVSGYYCNSLPISKVRCGIFIIFDCQRKPGKRAMDKKKSIMCLAAVLCVFVMAEVAFCQIYVDTTAVGLGDGSSWSDAYVYLQDALFQAYGVGDAVDIYVAQGSYTADVWSYDPCCADPCCNDPCNLGDPNTTFLLMSGVGLYGGFPTGGCVFEDRDPNNYLTILSGDLLGNDVAVEDPCDLAADPCRADNTIHVVTGSGTDATSVLDGFTISGGYALQDNGGGMYCNNGSPTVNNCVFVNNVAESGGGFYNYYYGEPVLTNCDFIGNVALTNSGGGMCNNNKCNPSLTDCRFIGNIAESSGGGIRNSYRSNVKLRGCVFVDNTAYSGGGISSDEETVGSVLTSCEFQGNTAVYGGSIWCRAGVFNLVNCVFFGNEASGAGGGIYVFFASDTILMNCLFSGNSAPYGGAICGLAYFSTNNLAITNCTFAGSVSSNGKAIYCDSDYGQDNNVAIKNCVMWDGGDEIWYDPCDSPAITVDNSDIQGGWSGGTGNIDIDPCFVRYPSDGGDGWGVGGNDDYGDLHLQENSPCRNVGDNSALPSDFGDVDNDGDFGEQVPWDIDLSDRIFDDGHGGLIVDMGAYELVYVVPTGEVDVFMVARILPSASDTSATLPVSDIDPNTAAGGDPFWQRESCLFYVEVWLRSDEVPSGISSGSVELTYDPCYVEAIAVDHGGVFVDDPCESIDNIAGLVTFAGSTSAEDMGDDEYVLFGRVQFVGDGPVDAHGKLFGPFGMNLSSVCGDDEFVLVGIGDVSGDCQAAPPVSIEAIVYDINNDDVVDLYDFGEFSSAYGGILGEPEEPDGPFVTWADFDGSGLVDSVDFGYFATGYLEQFDSAVIIVPVD